MKNVTISMDEETAAWTRIEAAKANVSVSRFVGELLERERRRDLGYDEAYAKFRNQKPVTLRSQPGERYRSRDELHDRAGLR